MRNQAGFTLQEVMITIAIAGIVSAIAVPNYLGWMPRHRLESGTSDVVMALNAARLEAIKAAANSTSKCSRAAIRRCSCGSGAKCTIAGFRERDFYNRQNTDIGI